MKIYHAFWIAEEISSLWRSGAMPVGDLHGFFASELGFIDMAVAIQIVLWHALAKNAAAAAVITFWHAF